ncbi:hypothetical protein [Xenorhabdus koppenhoeferi]|uniref:Uncharacterized protein n=1 Tax=Xenorhabdus koppenhoeferi TaxID=351659 RepID=A0A1I7H5Z1_9GAMM|nr:hypothetical protein [Xenorhabdus koppenhoeferi]SFU56081.1 hypothetical protein SAMN05421784_11183 [Xenorhabdus koppenhoeferi]
MRPISPFIQKVMAGNPLYLSFIVVGIVFLLLIFILAIRSHSSIIAIRHRRYHQTAKRILKKLPSISNNESQGAENE